jgi:hypothetical protein
MVAVRTPPGRSAEGGAAGALVAVLVLGCVVAGCFGGDDDDAVAGDASTTEPLEAAWAALEDAAQDVPDAALPKLNGEVEVVKPGERYTASRVAANPLIEYLGERGTVFGVAVLPDGETPPGSAVAAVEELDAAGSLTLIVPAEARHGTASELLAAGATFAARSPDGGAYCIAADHERVRRCQGPE